MVKLLHWYEEHEEERLMAEGYAAMANENLREAESAMGAQAEVVFHGQAW
ncbi:MAG TPA: hypothetical protein GX513_12495 [Firmicutes bacterium]|nr:hypothetical protein [Bacillota bacterium]